MLLHDELSRSKLGFNFGCSTKGFSSSAHDRRTDLGGRSIELRRLSVCCSIKGFAGHDRRYDDGGFICE